ncbi:hypothetical protein [uncultured Brevibacterium sp.]|uniref:hypothetical protein n=1 Tax=uncultured Brevibacterium sp. TaxID=189678 RepID=UPI0025DBF5A1|nr:hypothetical protein [uncultured Brevibacterium sp.]
MLIDLLIAAGAALLAAVAGLPVTSGVLRLAAREDGAGENDLGELEGEDSTEDSTEESAEPNVPDPTPTASTGVMRGGLMIGVLERALAAAAVALGRGEVLAVIIAVKGLGRIPELKNSRAAGERFIIGTFASLGVGCAVGSVAFWLTQVV